MSVLLDTHVWIRWLTLQPNVAEVERKALDLHAEQREIFIPAISLWEAQMLHARRRIQLPVRFADWLRRASAPDVVTLLRSMRKLSSRWILCPSVSTAIPRIV